MKLILRRDPERLQKLRTAVRYLLKEDVLARGHQSQLAQHFNMSRQRVHQVVNEEQERQQRIVQIREAQRLAAESPALPDALPDSQSA